jgi:hypothetical protein
MGMIGHHRQRRVPRTILLVAILTAAVGVVSVPSASAAGRRCAAVHWHPGVAVNEGSSFIRITVVGITCAKARPVILAVLRSPSSRPPKPWRKRANVNTGAVTFFLGHEKITGWFVN